jgi:hypothetical protein
MVSGRMLMALVVAAGFAPGDDDKPRADAIAKASISLSEAVTRAEAKAGGKALEAEKDQAFFEVEVLKDGAEIEAKIDPLSGMVIKMEKEDWKQAAFPRGSPEGRRESWSSKTGSTSRGPSARRPRRRDSPWTRRTTARAASTAPGRWTTT